MKYRLTAGIVIGVAMAAVMLGAVQIAGAAGDSEIRACANKKTGSIRLLTRGVCSKKSETRLSWNKQGPQGVQGAKGETGQVGVTGSSSVVVDAAGKEIGPLLGVNQGSRSFVVVNGQRIWELNSQTQRGWGMNQISILYSDSNCRQRVGMGDGSKISDQVVFGYTDSNLGTYISVSQDAYAFWSDMTKSLYKSPDCQLASIQDRRYEVGGSDSKTYFYILDSIMPPSYAPPLRIVQR